MNQKKDERRRLIRLTDAHTEMNTVVTTFMSRFSAMHREVVRDSSGKTISVNFEKYSLIYVEGPPKRIDVHVSPGEMYQSFLAALEAREYTVEAHYGILLVTLPYQKA